MLDMATISNADRIRTVVNEFIADASVIRTDQDLQELGMTSMQMVNLMLSIEAEFDVTIPGAKLVPANFRTIDNMVALVDEMGR